MNDHSSNPGASPTPIDIAALTSRYRELVQRVQLVPRLAKHEPATEDSAERTLGTTPPVLIAVSKKQPWQAIEALYRLGHRDFGENYAQELAEKAAMLSERGCDEIRWHFIGHLQTNKARLVAPWVHAVHSIDSLRLAQELSKRMERPLECFLEVNIDGEESKAGVVPADAPALAREVAALPNLKLQGLMAIPAPALDGPATGADLAHPFVRLRALELACRPATRGGLSMGMSSDFEAALREGATHVRVGTVIFGARV